jgi:RNA ligase (TIGR02306 family)
MSEITRKLATVRRITALTPIPGADRIQLATVDGWKVVVQNGLYQVGDLACYFEIDSFIPTAIAPFLTKGGHFPKTYNGIEGERLKTVRLRKTLSQGLLIPLTELFETKIIDGQLCAIINTPNSEVAGAQNVDLQDNEHS